MRSCKMFRTLLALVYSLRTPFFGFFYEVVYMKVTVQSLPLPSFLGFVVMQYSNTFSFYHCIHLIYYFICSSYFKFSGSQPQLPFQPPLEIYLVSTQRDFLTLRSSAVPSTFAVNYYNITSTCTCSLLIRC